MIYARTNYRDFAVFSTFRFVSFQDNLRQAIVNSVELLNNSCGGRQDEPLEITWLGRQMAEHGSNLPLHGTTALRTCHKTGPRWPQRPSCICSTVTLRALAVLSIGSTEKRRRCGSVSTIFSAGCPPRLQWVFHRETERCHEAIIESLTYFLKVGIYRVA